MLCGGGDQFALVIIWRTGTVVYRVRARNEHPNTTTYYTERVITPLVWIRFEKQLQRSNRVHLTHLSRTHKLLKGMV
jgi:hypothetical protein